MRLGGRRTRVEGGDGDGVMGWAGARVCVWQRHTWNPSHNIPARDDGDHHLHDGDGDGRGGRCAHRTYRTFRLRTHLIPTSMSYNERQTRDRMTTGQRNPLT